MRHIVPFARTDTGRSNAEEICEWLGVDEFLLAVGTQPPEVEFPLLIEYLIELSGSLECAYQSMSESLVEQYAESYNGHVMAVRKVKARIMEFAPKTAKQGQIALW